MRLHAPQAFQLFCPAFGSSTDNTFLETAYPAASIDQARRLCCADQPNPCLRWVMCKNVSLFYNKTTGREEATVVAVNIMKMEQSGRLVSTSVQQTVTAKLNCKTFLSKVGPQNPGPITFSEVVRDVPPPQPRSWAKIETLLPC